MTAAEHAATVRKVLIGWPYALRALDALEAQAARVEELEASEAEWQRRGDRSIKAEKRVEELEAALRYLGRLASEDDAEVHETISAALDKDTA